VLFLCCHQVINVRCFKARFLTECFRSLKNKWKEQQKTAVMCYPHIRSEQNSPKCLLRSFILSTDLKTVNLFQVLEGLIPNLPESLECLASGGHSTMADTKVYILPSGKGGGWKPIWQGRGFLS